MACLRPEWQEGTSTRAIHVGIDVEHPPWGVLERARESGALVSVETFKPAASPLPRDHLRKLADAVDFLSPNLVEARAMLGADASEADAPAAARLLADAGVPHAIVRAGASGAAWACPDGSLWHAPSVSGISVVDDCTIPSTVPTPRSVQQLRHVSVTRLRRPRPCLACPSGPRTSFDSSRRRRRRP